MSTNPEAVPNVPTPAIVTVIPVPEFSVIFHESLTVCPPPIVTFAGEAENELIVGAGHVLAVTVVCLEEDAPQPTVAVSV
jgi:hypothetical protein